MGDRALLSVANTVVRSHKWQYRSYRHNGKMPDGISTDDEQSTRAALNDWVSLERGFDRGRDLQEFGGGVWAHALL